MTYVRFSSSTSSSVECEGFARFDCNGVVHHEFLSHGGTVNKEYYQEVMRRLREAQNCVKSILVCEFLG